ncbi:hypothetical protein CTheo_6726 [Ceratobasidium theobromae]|uniref:Uncharacterized protein n=1 Tax=Ceratobasidium theobromae TaxID=1582974 RepID=A0A5N5QDS6_9AGAM|nr:hypothetical protein CTheo_6726 [Ceratobasidium theobromae]
MSALSPIPDPFESTPRASPTNDIVIEGLNHPTLFLPIPNTDPLNALLSKHIPAELRPHRDLVGRYEDQTLETLIMSNSWRALARMARDQIVATPPSDTALILDATVVSTLVLFGTYAAVQPGDSRVFQSLFGTRYYLSPVTPAPDCTVRTRRTARTNNRMARREPKVGESGTNAWTERGMRTGMMVVTQLVEMQDYSGALAVLRPLAMSPVSLPEIKFALARVMMEAGDAKTVQAILEGVEQDAITTALVAAMMGRWDEAEEVLRKALEEEKDNGIVINNLAVVLLSCGKLDEAIELLEGMLKSSPASFAAVEPFLYNLATLYELRSNAALERKRNILREVAQWGGDGLKVGSLKLPTQ